MGPSYLEGRGAAVHPFSLQREYHPDSQAQRQVPSTFGAAGGAVERTVGPSATGLLGRGFFSDGLGGGTWGNGN